MGVRGLTSMLTELLSLQDPSCYTQILEGSTLAIDGNGLAYHMYDQAYQSFYHHILQSFHENKQKTSTSHAALISSLLPCMMPLEFLTKACQTLMNDWVCRAKLHLSIYLDSTQYYNPFKQATLESRQEQRQLEEDQLEQFLLFSSLPWDRIPSAQELLQSFPRSSISTWFHPLLHEMEIFQLQYSDHVFIYESSDEADWDVAFQAAGDVSGNTLAVGQDSDYFIFGGDVHQLTPVPYIPLDSIQWKDGHLVGRVWTRSMVQEILDLPDEASVVEYSILLGNDFTKSFLRGITDIQSKTDLFADSDMASYLSHLSWRDQIRVQLLHRGAGYRVSSHHVELEQAIQYSRDFYTLQDLSVYSLCRIEDDDDDLGCSLAVKNLIQRMGFDTFRVDDHAPLTPATRALFSHSLRDRILSSLQNYYHNQTHRNEENESELPSSAVDPHGPCATRQYIWNQWTDYMTALDQSLSLLPSATPNANTIISNGGTKYPAAPHATHTLILPGKIHWSDYCMMTLVYTLIHDCVSSMRQDSSDLDIDSHTIHDAVPNCRKSKRVTGRSTPNYYGLFDKHKFLNIMMSQRQMKPSLLKSSHMEVGSIVTLSPPIAEQRCLPIDEHRDIILQSIQNHRVTVIQGETGCGKSTRVPVMILNSPPPDPSIPRVKMFITQPRRIAAKGLVEHVRASEPNLKHKFALRLGHGVREYESDSVQAWFCTTGYLVRYLARYPEKFKTVSHLIIDEVHERSVETDLLCLLSKRLLTFFPRLRLVLMSATIAADMYTDYFEVPQSPIRVSARRFPIREYYLDDLSTVVSLSAKEKKMIDELMVKAQKVKGPVVPSHFEVEQLYHLAVYLTKTIGSTGSSVLIFVAGMNDIVSITELIEKIVIPGISFICLPVHSDVPMEDQLSVFQPPGPNQVKVIIATNAAESSITLPDIDHVICLGLCKQIMYNEQSHRQMLSSSRISKASAIQRAGRTGRVREGSVYRLYPRKTFELQMHAFEIGEILRMPLDSVILSIKDMIPDESISELLSLLIEPPEELNVTRSLQALHRMRFLTEASENSHLTSLGSFVVSIGIDLCLGTLIGWGFKLGLPTEAITFAAVLSFPKSPWLIANASFHEPQHYNDIIVKTYFSKNFFDSGLYSDVFATMNMLYDYGRAKNKAVFVHKHSLSNARIKQLYNTVQHLQSRVATVLGQSDCKIFRMTTPPRNLPYAKIMVLRLLQIFTFPDFIIVSKNRRNLRNDGQYSLTCTHTEGFENEMINKLLNPKDFEYSIRRKKRVIYNGLAQFECKLGPSEERLISYGLENDMDIILTLRDDFVQLYIPNGSMKQLHDYLGKDFNHTMTFTCQYHDQKNTRGVRGRACGLWSVKRQHDDFSFSESKNSRIVNEYTVVHANTKKLFKDLIKTLGRNDVTLLALSVTNLVDNARGFSITTYGDLKSFTHQDATDLFLTSDIKMTAQSDGSQEKIDIVFSKLDQVTVNMSSNDKRMVDNIPVGARVLEALACGHHKKHIILLSQDSDEKQVLVELKLPRETRFVDYWKNVFTNCKMFVDSSSIPASVCDMNGDVSYASCANYLELKGGSARVDGLTIIPSDCNFVALALTCCIGLSIDPQLRRLCDLSEPADSLSYFERVDDAILFHNAVVANGDSLIYDESLANHICRIFNLSPWIAHQIPILPRS